MGTFPDFSNINGRRKKMGVEKGTDYFDRGTSQLFENLKLQGGWRNSFNCWKLRIFPFSEVFINVDESYFSKNAVINIKAGKNRFGYLRFLITFQNSFLICSA